MKFERLCEAILEAKLPSMSAAKLKEALLGMPDHMTQKQLDAVVSQIKRADEKIDKKDPRGDVKEILKASRSDKWAPLGHKNDRSLKTALKYSDDLYFDFWNEEEFQKYNDPKSKSVKAVKAGDKYFVVYAIGGYKNKNLDKKSLEQVASGY